MQVITFKFHKYHGVGVVTLQILQSLCVSYYNQVSLCAAFYIAFNITVCELLHRVVVSLCVNATFDVAVSQGRSCYLTYPPITMCKLLQSGFTVFLVTFHIMITACELLHSVL